MKKKFFIGIGAIVLLALVFTPAITQRLVLLRDFHPSVLLAFRDTVKTVVSDSLAALSADGVTITNSGGTFKQKVFADTTSLKSTAADSVGMTVILKQLSGSNAQGSGEFVWRTSGTPDGGTVFAATGGYWVRKETINNPGYVNIQWWGADPDGAIADTAVNSIALQAAIDYADSTRGNNGEVFIPAGHFKFNRQLFIRGNQSQSGTASQHGYLNIVSSKGAVLEYTGDTTAITIGGGLTYEDRSGNGYITIQDLYLVGPDSTSTLSNCGIDYTGWIQVTTVFDRLIIENFATGIRFHDATDMTMTDFHIRQCGTGIAAGYKTDKLYARGSVTRSNIGIHVGYIDTRYSATSQASYTQNWQILANGNNIGMIIGGNGTNNVTVRNSYFENNNINFQFGHDENVWGTTEANWINGITFDGVHIADISGAKVDSAIQIYSTVLNFHILNSYYTMDSGVPIIDLKTAKASATRIVGEFDSNYSLRDSTGLSYTMGLGFRWNRDMEFLGDGFLRLTHYNGDPSPSFAKSGEVMIDTATSLMNAQVVLQNKSGTNYWYNFTPVQSEEYFYGNDFHPLHNNFVSTYAERDTISNNFSKIVYKFDDAQDEYIAADFIVRNDFYNSDSIYADIYWYSPTATSGNVSWGFQFNRFGAGSTTNSTSPVSTLYRSRATNGTAYLLNKTTIGQLTTNLAAGDVCKAIIRRDGDGSSATDDMSGDAYLIAVKIRYGKR